MHSHDRKYDEDSTSLLIIFQILMLAIGGEEYIMMCSTSASGTPVLNHAANNCKEKEVLEYLLKMAPNAVKQKDNYGKTPLHAACGNKNWVAMKTLAAANPYALLTKSDSQETPLDKYRDNGGKLKIEQERSFIDSSFEGYFRKYCPKGTKNFGKLLVSSTIV